MADWETAPQAAGGGWETAPSEAGWETAPAPAVAPKRPTGAQPGSVSFALQGALAPWESLGRMILGQIGQSVGALGTGAGAAVETMREGRLNPQAGDFIKQGMAAGGDTMTPSKTLLAPTRTFDEALGHLFDAVREHIGNASANIENLRGNVARRIAPKALEPYVRERPEAARALGEYGFDATAAVSPFTVARGAVRRAPATIEGESTRVPEEPVGGGETAFEGVPPPPRSQTSSGVPIKLDRLIAEAERNANPIEPPPVKGIIRQAAQEGKVAPQQGATRLDALLRQATDDYQLPPPPDVKGTIRDIKKAGPQPGQARFPENMPEPVPQPLPPRQGRLEENAPESPQAAPEPSAGLSEPPRAEAPEAAPASEPGQGFTPIDMGRLDEVGANRVIRSETLEGGKAGGRAATVNQALSWLEPERGKGRAEVDAAIFDAGREYDKPENKQRAFNELYAVFDEQPGLRAEYPEFYTERGQVDKRAVEAEARRYHTYVSTQMNAARRAGEGRDTALHPGSFDDYRGGAAGEFPPGFEPTGRGPEAPREAAPEGEIPAPPAETPKRTYADPRLEQSDYPEQLRALGAEAGQQETGGRLIKDETVRGPDTGEVGRTSWIAEPWYREMQRMPEFRSSPEGVRTIIEKAINGEKLGPKQQKILSYLLDEVQYRLEGDAPRGGGTLSANPMFDPHNWKSLFKPLTAANEFGKKLLNNIQAMPESAYPAAAAGYDFARANVNAHHMAQTDRAAGYKDVKGIEKDYREAVAEAQKLDPNYRPRTPKNYAEAVADTEQARVRAATIKLQQELLRSGAAIVPGKGAKVDGYTVPQNYKAFTTPGGRTMMLRKDVAPVLEQMVAGYDWAAERRYMGTLGGKIEQGAHGLSGMLLAVPTFHMVTAGGRIAPAVINTPKNSLLRFADSARKSMNDRAEMQDMMKHGVQFWPKRGTMEPQGAKAGAIEKGLKDMGLGGVYDGYQWFHNDVLGNAVNWMATSYYQWRLNQLKEAHKGELDAKTLDTYKTMAGRDASLAVANLAKEEGNRSWFRLLGSTAFSRGLQVSTVRMATRALEGDKMLEAVARRNGMTKEQAKGIMEKNKTFLARQLVKDYVAMQVAANAINYFTTSMTDEPNGQEGGHFVWENQGSDKSQWFLPTNIYVGRETDSEGSPTGRAIYMSTPFRSARDVVEYAMLPFEMMQGKELRLLKNKMSVPLKVAQETIAGSDWAGRPLGGVKGTAQNLASHMTPSPFEDVPRFAFESFAQNNPTYFSEGMAKVFNPTVFGMKVAGAQPRISSTDAETTMLQSKQTKEEEKVWGRARQIKKDLFGMEADTRERAVESVMEDARTAGMDAKGQKAISRYLQQEGVTKGAKRSAQRFLSVNPQYQREGEIGTPPQ